MLSRTPPERFYMTCIVLGPSLWPTACDGGLESAHEINCPRVVFDRDVIGYMYNFCMGAVWTLLLLIEFIQIAPNIRRIHKCYMVFFRNWGKIHVLQNSYYDFFAHFVWTCDYSVPIYETAKMFQLLMFLTRSGRSPGSLAQVLHVHCTLYWGCNIFLHVHVCNNLLDASLYPEVFKWVAVHAFMSTILFRYHALIYIDLSWAVSQ